MRNFIVLTQTGVLKSLAVATLGGDGDYEPNVVPFLERGAVTAIDRIVNTDAILAVWVDPVTMETCVSFVNHSDFARDVWTVSNPYRNLLVDLGAAAG